MQNYILYLAYGADYINECSFSLLKYLSIYNLQPPKSNTIVVYTDDPARFDHFIPFFTDFRIKTITPDLLKSWQGKPPNPYRVKAFLIKKFSEEHNGAILFCDTDTFLIQPLESLFHEIHKGNSYMYQMEGEINAENQPRFRKWYRFIEKAKKNNVRFPEFSNEMAWTMYNSGVVGLNQESKIHLTNVVELTDYLFSIYRHHTTEQLAISYLISKHTQVNEAKDYIFHYWNLKEFRSLLRDFFEKNAEESVSNLIKLVHHLNPMEMQTQKEHYQQLPVYKKWLLTLTGKNWSIKQYQHKF